MKKIIILCFLILSSCETCDSLRYQIQNKKEIGNGQCEYTVWAFTNCPAWSVRNKFKFTANCTSYQISQILTKNDIK